MPELPEVETTRLGLLPHLKNQTLERLTLRRDKLRFPLEKSALEALLPQTLSTIERRGKYLLFKLQSHTLLLHLGMSGSLRLEPLGTAPKTHDHIIYHFPKQQLHYHDPRRFGSLEILKEGRLKKLGIEPLSDEFNGAYLHQHIKNRKSAIKTLIMDQNIVVGVGNIYASEALFISKISPLREGASLNIDDCTRLCQAIKQELTRAIAVGGTTLKDFIQPDGTHGYFSQELKLYGKKKQNCPNCKTPLEARIITGRNSIFCPNCQK